MSGLSLRLDGRVALVTGGYGVLGGSLVDGLVGAGARVAILGRRREAAEEKAEAVRQAGGEAIALGADVLDEQQVSAARDQLIASWHRVDILINAVGGNVARAREFGWSETDYPAIVSWFSPAYGFGCWSSAARWTGLVCAGAFRSPSSHGVLQPSDTPWRAP
jgi:NAD(P)-dependent dehydrogenase (short-subunit alcohol dehydrogenase family)